MSEELKIVAEQYGISVEDAGRVLTAFKENRVTIRRKYTDERCGTCANYMREPGGRNCSLFRKKEQVWRPHEGSSVQKVLYEIHSQGTAVVM